MKKLFTLFMLGFSIASFAQVNISFKIKAINPDGVEVDTTEGVYIVGDVTDWVFRPMEDLGGHEYQFDTTLIAGDTLSYYFILVNSWDSLGNEDWNYYKKFRESFDSTSVADCTPDYAAWEGDRWIVVPEEYILFSSSWNVLCPEETTGIQSSNISLTVNVYPNPSNGQFKINLPSGTGLTNLEVYDLTGKIIKSVNTRENNISLDLSESPAGLYIVKASNGLTSAISKILVR